MTSVLFVVQTIIFTGHSAYREHCTVYTFTCTVYVVKPWAVDACRYRTVIFQLFFFFFSVVLVINYFLPCTASDIRARENTEMGKDGKELG